MPGFEVFGEEEKKEVLDIFDTGVLFRYEFGPQRKGVYKVREFEEAFAALTGAEGALAVSSGTAAVKVALAALGVGPGDEVIVPGFTFVATWEAVLDIGAVPVLAEVDSTLNLDPKLIPSKITPRTKAIIVVHMLGSMADIEGVLKGRRGYPGHRGHGPGLRRRVQGQIPWNLRPGRDVFLRLGQDHHHGRRRHGHIRRPGFSDQGLGIPRSRTRPRSGGTGQ